MEVEYDPSQKPDATDFINYSSLARQLFEADGAVQGLVPFLGAGASLPFHPSDPPAKLTEPEQEHIEDVCRELKLASPLSIELMELAARVARRLEQTHSPPAVSYTHLDVYKRQHRWINIMNISGLVCAISSRLWGLPPRIDNSFFIFFHKFLS